MHQRFNISLCCKLLQFRKATHFRQCDEEKSNPVSDYNEQLSQNNDIMS